MAKRLINHYQDILQNLDGWDYYKSEANRLQNVYELFKSEKNALAFVQDYLNNGCKKDLLLDKMDKMSGRWAHTVSVFLLGITIAKVAFDIHFEDIDNHQNHQNLYLWYLACLYHDYGYVIENNKRKYPPCKMPLDAVLTKTIGKKNAMENPFTFCNAEFSKQIVNEYFDYKRIHCNFVNHGTVGGMIMYSELCHILEEKLRGGDCIEENGIYWYKGQETDFAQCANAIIAHNIWFEEDSPFAELKLDVKNRHVYKDWLTALLVLTDTIEPVKQFCCKPLKVLENMALEVKDNAITIAWCGPECCSFEGYFARCKKMAKWANVKVTAKDNYAKISSLKAMCGR